MAFVLLLFYICLQKLQSMLLGPLHDLSGIMQADIRQKQLDCVMQILHNNGDSLGQGWPLVLGVIGALKSEHRYCFSLLFSYLASALVLTNSV